MMEYVNKFQTVSITSSTFYSQYNDLLLFSRAETMDQKQLQSSTSLQAISSNITFMIIQRKLEEMACHGIIQMLKWQSMDQKEKVCIEFWYLKTIIIMIFTYLFFIIIIGSIEMMLDDTKKVGEETFYFIGCFDDTYFDGFKKIAKTSKTNNVVCP